MSCAVYCAGVSAFPAGVGLSWSWRGRGVAVYELPAMRFPLRVPLYRERFPLTFRSNTSAAAVFIQAVRVCVVCGCCGCCCRGWVVWLWLLLSLARLAVPAVVVPCSSGCPSARALLSGLACPRVVAVSQCNSKDNNITIIIYL